MITERRTDLIGQRFGKLVVIDFSEIISKHAYWNCACDCGGHIKARGSGLLQSAVFRCRDCFFEGTHGARKDGKTPEYSSWLAMRSRCRNANATGYERYGGAGVKIDPRWDDFAAFLEDMGKRPSLNHSLDRYPDKAGDYKPENCRWATAKEQANNRRERRRNQTAAA